MLVKRWNWEGLSWGNAEEQMIMLLPRHIRVYSVWYCRYRRSVDTLVIPSSLWDWARSSISAFLRLSALLIIPGRRPATMTMSSSSINSERLSPDPISCPCDNTILETRNHILTECPRYTHHRKILKKASRHLSLPVVLGTTKGISALAEFITKTGAFSKTGSPPTKPQAPSFINEPIPILNPAVDPTLVFDDGGWSSHSKPPHDNVSRPTSTPLNFTFIFFYSTLFCFRLLYQ